MIIVKYNYYEMLCKKLFNLIKERFNIASENNPSLKIKIIDTLALIIFLVIIILILTNKMPFMKLVQEL